MKQLKNTGPVKLFARHLKAKTNGLRQGGVSSENKDQIGLIPSQGWTRRNMEYLGKVLIPQALKKRLGQQRQLVLDDVPRGKARIVWIGHASFLIQTEGKNILIDPNWAMWLTVVKRARLPGIALESLPPIDLVLITHAHHDHLDLPTLDAIARRQPIVVPKGVESLVKRRGFSDIIELDRWDQVNFDGLQITFTPARHWGARFVHDIHRGFGGYLLQSEHAPTIYHAGDSAYFDGFHQIGERAEIDVALMPIGAYRPVSGRSVHMNPEEALAAFIDLGAKKMIPMHYGSFPLTREPLHEPLHRLMLVSSSAGLRHKIVVLEEGEVAVF